ncbi:MAG: protein-S-isoprenylcysteine O-methyltransferase [Planctomycetota bacterium]
MAALLDRPFDVVFLAGFAVYVALRGHYQSLAKGQETVERRRGAREVMLLVLVAIGCVLLPVAYLATPWLAFADYELPAAVRWAGVPAMVAGLWLFWRSHRDLGRFWSATLEIREGHQLVTTGIYRRIRHPMYAAIWLVSLAQGLLLGNWLAGWAAVAAFGAMYWLRIEREERLLLDCFGEQWRAHCAVTGRLWPRLAAASSPRSPA